MDAELLKMVQTSMGVVLEHEKRVTELQSALMRTHRELGERLVSLEKSVAEIVDRLPELADTSE